MITIVDYGMGNLGSVRNMFQRIGVASAISSDPDEIGTAAKIVLPGVGAFDSAMRRLAETGLDRVLSRKALDERVPVLGICLGMQLLCSGSEEGQLPGLGWIEAEARRFPPDLGLKIPHMGWNIVQSAVSSPLTDWMEAEVEARFYFVHSYAVQVRDQANSLLKCTYGIKFDAGIRRDNIYGAQFHPEKSHRFGMQLLSAFADLPC